MATNVYVGLCVTSHADGVISAAAFSDVNLTSPLPSPWKNSDIGIVGAAGSASYNDGSFIVNGSGIDIWDTADEFQFVYQSLNGDGTIVARVNSLTNTHGWAKAGVMIRESLNANSAHATSVVTASNGVSFQNRTIAGGISSHTTLPGHTAPKWVKIERSGNTFTSSYSSDGSTWTVIGTGVIAMATNVYVGLCVTSHADGVISSAAFSDVIVTGGNTEKENSSSGRNTTSTVVTTEGEETSPEIAVFPNPVKDRLTVTYTSATAQEAQISIKSATSLTGKQMVIPLHPGLNSIEVDIHDSQKGMYIVSIITSDGKRCVTKVMVTK
jgi:regulation of enolase protein 1 (concanavalin A-like superfamily)